MPDTMPVVERPRDQPGDQPNDQPGPLDALLNRASVHPRFLREPAPDEAALRQATAAALRAPDHGGLRPWRFVAVSGEARAALGQMMARSLARRAPGTPVERLDKERDKPCRAPLVVVVGVAVNHARPGVPPWEQEACVAAGTMNFLNALHAQGFGAMWVSSDGLRDPAVKVALGFADTDSVLGMVFVGTPAETVPAPARPEPDRFLRHWSPPG